MSQIFADFFCRKVFENICDLYYDNFVVYHLKRLTETTLEYTCLRVCLNTTTTTFFECSPMVYGPMKDLSDYNSKPISSLNCCDTIYNVIYDVA